MAGFSRELVKAISHGLPALIILAILGGVNGCSSGPEDVTPSDAVEDSNQGLDTGDLPQGDLTQGDAPQGDIHVATDATDDVTQPVPDVSQDSDQDATEVFAQDILPQDTGIDDVFQDQAQPLDICVIDAIDAQDICLTETGGLCCGQDSDCAGRLLDSGEDACHPAICSDIGCVVGSGVVCSALDDCHQAGECDPLTGLCGNPVVDDGAPCAWDGTCVQGKCVYIADGGFHENLYWTPTNGAEINTSTPGNGDSGSATIPYKVSASVSQIGPSIPYNTPVMAGYDVFGHCTEWLCYGGGPSISALYVNGIAAVVGRSETEMWRSSVSCLGESAYGDNVEFRLAEKSTSFDSISLEFDNVRLDVVDEHTCPAVGTVLNGDTTGSFGWEICPDHGGTITYGTDESMPFVQVSSTPSQTEITCMSTWFSAPLATTLPNAAIKYQYRSGGVIAFGTTGVITNSGDGNGEIGHVEPNAASWTDVVICIPSALAGRADRLRFVRNTRAAADTDFIAIRNIRIESDPTDCP